ncbi:MAG: hypothetical protein WC413_01495 [Candidatus Nanoarchaeia archaeon]
MKINKYSLEKDGNESQLVIYIPLSKEQLPMFAKHFGEQGDLEDLLKIEEVITPIEEIELEQELEEVETPGHYVELGDGTGKLPGEEMLTSPGKLDSEKDKEIEDEDVPGIGYRPNTIFADFKAGLLKDKKGGVLGEEELFNKLEHLANTFELPSVDMYYNRSGQDQALTKYQASLNYLVALASGLGEGKALSHAFAARYSLLPKRIKTKEGQLYFPHLEKEQSNLKIFGKLHKLFFQGIKDINDKVIIPVHFLRSSVKNNDKQEVVYYAAPWGSKSGKDSRIELDKRYTPFLEDLNKLLPYINDNPNDDQLSEDKRANLIEAGSIVAAWMLPSHFMLEGYPDSRAPHTVESGIELLNTYGGSYKEIAKIIKRVCYDHRKF